MSKKIISLLLSVTMLLSLVAVSALAEDTGEKTQLRFMCNLTESDSNYDEYVSIIDSYNAMNDKNVEIVLEAYENEQFKTKLVTLMASNSVPDIFFTWELDYLRPFVEAGRVADITSYLENDPDWKNTFSGGTLETVTYDDKLYAIPTQKSLCGMFYNKQIFADNNVEVPTTYEEFLAACETFKQAGITPMALCGTDSWIPAQFVEQLTDGIAGMDLFYGIGRGELQWNDPDHIQAGEELKMMVEKEYFQSGFIGMGPEESKAKFANGETAMYFMGFWDSAYVEENLGENAGVFALPAQTPEYSNILVGSVDTCFSIAESSEYKDEAMDFLKYWTNQDNELMLLYECGRIPAGVYDFDASKLSPLTAELISISNANVGMTPWWDRAFGAGEGVEFNNTCVAICGGEDVQESFDSLQQFAEENAE